MGLTMRGSAVVVAALAPAAAALATGPPPTNDATGPLPYALYESQRNGATELELFVAPSGNRIRFAAVSYRVTCRRHGRRTHRPRNDDIGGIVLEAGRRFVRRERFRAAGQRGRRTLSGRFDADWTAASVRYETRFRARDGARCYGLRHFRPGRVESTTPPAVVAPALPPPAPPPPPPVPPAGHYAGTTATGDAISFTLPAVGAPAEALATTVTLKCAQKEVRREALHVARADKGKLRKNGKFNASGRSADLAYALNGTVKGAAATGRLSVTSSYSNRVGGDVSDQGRCRTGAIRFTVQRT